MGTEYCVGGLECILRGSHQGVSISSLYAYLVEQQYWIYHTDFYSTCFCLVYFSSCSFGDLPQLPRRFSARCYPRLHAGSSFLYEYHAEAYGLR
jgi:hypothetical protein